MDKCKHPDNPPIVAYRRKCRCGRCMQASRECRRERRKISKLRGHRRATGPRRSLAGKMVGCLRVLDSFQRRNGNYFWQVECVNCSERKWVSYVSLARVETKRRCRCEHVEYQRLTWQTKGIYYVIGNQTEKLNEKTGKKEVWWLCKCLSCKSTLEVKAATLRYGQSRSCPACRSIRAERNKPKTRVKLI